MVIRTLHGFIDFIREQGVVGLAVGFLLGGAISKLVTTLITDLVTPILGILLGAAGSLKDQSVTIGSAKILWGDAVSAAIDFLIIAIIVYLIVRKLGLSKLDKPKQ
jgi:large conductance mechanosensitive channel